MPANPRQRAAAPMKPEQTVMPGELLKFEAAVFRRQYRVALDHLFPLTFGVAGGKTKLPANATDRLAFYTRFTAAITALFADPALQLTPSDVQKLNIIGMFIGNIFLASAYRQSDDTLRLLLPQLKTISGTTDTNTANKFRALFSANCGLDVQLPALLDTDPTTALMTYARLMATTVAITPQAHQWREKLLDYAPHVRPAALPVQLDQLTLLVNAWMLCSYGAHPRKHAIKTTFNVVLRDWMIAQGLTDSPMPSPRPMPARPKLLVMAEVMHSNHVQYRYFGQWLRQLAPHFRLSLVTEQPQVDDHVRTLFEEIFTFRRSTDVSHIHQIVAHIKAQAPDLIFYLSVGMRHWGPPIANLRLAPIQFAAIGHSASTYCPTMDYYLIEQGYVSDPKLVTETTILLDDRSLRFERSPHYQPLPPAIREKPPVLKVAIASNLRKLNAPFLNVCRDIAMASPRPLEFHFFPNTDGLEADAAAGVITRALPRCVIHRLCDYKTYLQMLNESDLSFSPFPFGGLHSVVDCLRQGVPVVAMECPEPHGRTDSMILRRLGLPEWLIATNEEAYKTAALELVTNDAKRVALAKQSVALNIDAELFGDGTTPPLTHIADAVRWIYRNHERIQADGRHAWTPAEREKF